MQPTVLLLSTYPLVEPRHGGQIRLAGLAAAYRGAGCNVASIAVYDPESFAADQVGGNDFPFPLDSPYRWFRGRYVWFIADLQTGVHAAADDGGFAEVARRLPARVDVVHVEQPWLWPVAMRLRALPHMGWTLLVYGSQNVERDLKEEIFKTYDMTHCEDVLEEIDALERRAAREADFCLAVTQADAEQLKAWGAQSVLLAPNAIAPWQADEARLAHWRARLPGSPWLLYVASAHPPNFKHINRILGGSLASIPPTGRFVVAGSVGGPVAEVLAQSRWAAVNASRLLCLGMLDDADLAAVKTLAHGFLLPIAVGGGSNIKTAEALYSGAYVIGTTAAFRGFKPFLALPEVYAADTPADMHAAIRTVLASPRADGDRGGLRQTLTWDHALKEPIAAIVAAVARGADA